VPVTSLLGHQRGEAWRSLCGVAQGSPAFFDAGVVNLAAKVCARPWACRSWPGKLCGDFYNSALGRLAQMSYNWWTIPFRVALLVLICWLAARAAAGWL
jgi:hypothetical protein